MNRLARRLVVPGLAVLGLATVVGCTPGGAPSATPTPTVPTCSPLDGSTPYPCTQAEFDELASQWALYEEAEGVLRRYVAEDVRQAADWRLREVTPEIEATTTGTYRRAYEEYIEQARASETRRVSDPAPIAWVRPLIGESNEGSIVALQACVDATSESYVSKARPSPGPGVAVVHSYFFVREDGVLKITTSDFEDVASC